MYIYIYMNTFCRSALSTIIENYAHVTLLTLHPSFALLMITIGCDQKDEDKVHLTRRVSLAPRSQRELASFFPNNLMHQTIVSLVLSQIINYTHDHSHFT